MPGLSEAISIEGSDGLKDAAGADPPRKKSRKKKQTKRRMEKKHLPKNLKIR
jgi:hypothetical protein